MKTRLKMMILATALFAAAPVMAQDNAEQPTEPELAPSEEAPPNVEETQTPSGEVTPFEELVAEALGEHPAVRQRRAEVAAEEARLKGVGLKPDPMVSLAAEAIPWDDWRLSRTPMSGIKIGVTQPLWWPGELAALREQVEARAEAMRPTIDEQQVELVIEAAGLYYELYRIDRTIEALRDLKTPLREFIDLLKARIPTGDASVAQVERVRLELLNIDDQIFFLMHQRPERVARINTLLNREAGSPVNPPDEGDVGELHPQTGEPLPSLEELVERGMKNRPAVEVLQRRKEVARAEARAASYATYPDLKVFGGWKFRAEQESGMDDGTDFFTVGVSSSIPVWSGDRAEAAEDVAQAQVISLDAAIDRFRLELRGEIEAHLAELHHLTRHTEFYRDKLIPQAEQARRAALAGFKAGRAAYEDWLQAEQKIVELKSRLVKLESGIRMHRALILATIGEVPIAQQAEPSGDLEDAGGDE